MPISAQAISIHAATRLRVSGVCGRQSFAVCKCVCEMGIVCPGQPEMWQKTFAMLACACSLCSAMLTALSFCSSTWRTTQLHKTGHRLRQCSTEYTNCCKSPVCRFGRQYMSHIYMSIMYTRLGYHSKVPRRLQYLFHTAEATTQKTIFTAALLLLSNLYYR